MILERLRTLNYACAIANLRFRSHELIPELLIVYYNNDGSIEERLPCGSVKFEDIAEAVTQIRSSMEAIEQNKVQSIFDQCITLSGEMDKIMKDLEKKYRGDRKESCNDFEKMKQLKKNFHFEHNEIFNSYMKNIFDFINASVKPKTLVAIIEASRRNTISRELQYEVNAFNAKKAAYHECCSSAKGLHQKIGYLCVDLDTPDNFQGSGDTDIEASSWVLLEDVFEKFSSAHLHAVILQSAIRKALELLRQEDSASAQQKIEVIRPYLIADDL